MNTVCILCIYSCEFLTLINESLNPDGRPYSNVGR